ncbi:MAG: Ig-like domain-containing protein [Bacteroidota bacterium]|nr:Ig-like domain-containing protein [Bacteroidota bacterium]
MKNNIIKFIGLFIAIAFIASCEQEAFEEYSSVPVADAPGLTLTIDSNTDSAITVSYNMNMAGRVTLAILPASVDTPTVADMQGRPTADYYYYKHDDGDAQATITYEGLEPYTEYRVYGVGQNLDGVFSDIIMTESVRTQDFVNPVIVAYSPEKAATGVSNTVLPTIEFSEPVTYVDGKLIELTGLFSGYIETIVADSIVYDGNKVSFKHSEFPFNDFIFINIDEGAFEDASGNISPEVYTVNGVQLDWYFRTEPDPDTQLSVIFENFLGDYECTDYSNADSTTVDWGPYSVTVSEDTDVEYGVIIDNFWAWGITAKFQFHEDGTITCSEQLLDVTLGDITGNPAYDDYGVWVKGWRPDIYTITVGHWDYTDFSFDIALAFLTDYGAKMQAYPDIYQSYEKPSGKALVGSKK